MVSVVVGADVAAGIAMSGVWLNGECIIPYVGHMLVVFGGALGGCDDVG
jgi:hypothetical protein